MPPPGKSPADAHSLRRPGGPKKKYTIYILHLTEVRERIAERLPLLIGSGVTLDNVDNYANAADALIVGSHLKMAGRWENAPDPERVQAFVGHLKGQQRL